MADCNKSHKYVGLLTCEKLGSVIFLAMIFSIAIAAVIYNDLWRVYYFMPGSYGSFFGLIAGPIGIGAANSKR